MPQSARNRPDAELDLERHVLVAAPTGRDATLTHALLHQVGIDSQTVDSAEEASRHLLETAIGTLVLTEESVTPTALHQLRRALDAQPPWSEVPIVLFANARQNASELFRMIDAFGPGASVTVLERPVRPPTLVSVVRSCLRARNRQYEVRDLLDQLERLNESLEHRVDERTSEVRTLASALTLAEQRERSRLSDLLHDHLQQLIFAAQLKLQLAVSQLEGRPAELVSQSDAYLRDAMKSVRTLTVELHPPILVEDGIHVALEWVAAHMEEQYGLHVEVDAPSVAQLPSRELLILLTQAVRELLFNIVKHADTDQAWVSVEMASDSVRLLVEDKGTGFDVSRRLNDPKRGHGLRAIRERLRLVGGDFHVASQPGEGTTMTLIVPIDAEVDVAPDLDA